MPAISIIIPVYNAAPYLAACIDSVIGQTFSDWELICINDGSTDGSESLLRQYALADARIQVFSQANAGVSTARNLGIERARGEYVCMVDSDDSLPPDALENLWQPIVEGYRPDVVFGCVMWKTEEGSRVCVSDSIGNGADDEGLLTDRAYIAGHASGLPSGKLYRRTIFQDGDIRYDTFLRIGEDQHLLFRFYMHCQRFYAVRKVVYHYINRGSSTMGRFAMGELPLRDYVRFFLSKAELVDALPQQWTVEERRDYALGVLAFVWRDWVRCMYVSAGVGIWRVAQMAWSLGVALRHFSLFPGVHPVRFAFGDRRPWIFGEGDAWSHHPVGFPFFILKETGKMYIKKLLHRAAVCAERSISRRQSEQRN